MTVEEIERLTAWCASAGIGEIELSEAGFSLRLHMQAVVAETPAAEAPKAETAFKGVRAPGVGVFRLDHPTTGRSVAEPGQTVRKGETVGVLQVGPCLKAIVAPADGVLGAALAEDGAVVGYGTPLYELV
ncbi:acetyl-CoA carboxylase biotin carboxyl carrier protein [Mesorhizobium cantuariense]|uniref:Acetyl-CoA carboxylase biotin carboxyl carrier protein n=1 Tax=Mesorhizobium cantuariense TaxID=1300275 RepID=A0ABV7MGW5_9HYPH